jgi:hypothetical protein
MLIVGISSYLFTFAPTVAHYSNKIFKKIGLHLPFLDELYVYIIGKVVVACVFELKNRFLWD